MKDTVISVSSVSRVVRPPFKLDRSVTTLRNVMAASTGYHSRFRRMRTRVLWIEYTKSPIPTNTKGIPITKKNHQKYFSIKESTMNRSGFEGSQ